MFCSDLPDPTFLIISDAVPSALLYYSHIPTAIIALLIAVFVFIKSKKSLLSQILLFLSIIFFFWSFFDLIVWTNIDSRIIMFVWSLFSLLYVLIYAASVYFFHVFLGKKDVSFTKKVVFLSFLLPVFLLCVTRYNLVGFNMSSCEAIEGESFTTYYHVLGLLVFFWILVVTTYRFWKEKNIEIRKQVVFLAVGIEFFLLSFFVSSYWASLNDNFKLEQYGLFGMTFFMGMLAFLIVKYKAYRDAGVGGGAVYSNWFHVLFRAEPDEPNSRRGDTDWNDNNGRVCNPFCKGRNRT